MFVDELLATQPIASTILTESDLKGWEIFMDNIIYKLL